MLVGIGTRALTSVAVVCVAVGLVYAPSLLLTIFLLALGFVGVMEMYALLGSGGVRPPLPLGLGLVALLVLSAANADIPLLDVGVFLAGAAPLVWGMLSGPKPGGIQAWAFASAGALYVGWPLAHFELLRFLPQGSDWLILAIGCTWATDTGAYICGSLFGRRKLAPRISPSKTIEGSAGAALLTVPVGLLLGKSTGLPVSVGGLVLLSLLLTLAAQTGDLAESYLKRIAAVKDSGTLLPGHGGLLDRIDGLLWAVVVTYYFVVVVL